MISAVKICFAFLEQVLKLSIVAVLMLKTCKAMNSGVNLNSKEIVNYFASLLEILNYEKNLTFPLNGGNQSGSMPVYDLHVTAQVTKYVINQILLLSNHDNILCFAGIKFYGFLI